MVPDLIDAVWANDVDQIAGKLSGGADPNVKHEGMSALEWALDLTFAESALALIAADCEVNGGDRTGRTPLMRAAFGDMLAVSKALLAAGAQIHALDDEGGPALHYAARKGSAATVAWFINNAGEVNQLDSSGRDALFWALSWKNFGAIRELVNAGADVNRRYGPQGHSLLMLAAIAKDVTSAQFLLDAGADPQATMVDGKRASDMAGDDAALLEALRPKA